MAMNVKLKNNLFTGFANKHHVIFFIMGAYIWSWAFWISANLEGLPPGLKLALTFMGVFGPALVGSFILRLRDGAPEARPRRWAGFLIGAGLAGSAIGMLYFDFFGINNLAPKPELVFPAEAPWYVYGLLGAVILVSGFVFSNIQSRFATVRSFYAGLVPNKRTLLMAIPVLLFLPVVLITSSALADILEIPYEQPEYLKQSVGVWLPLMFVKLLTVAMLTGGNEEHGWRGVLLPLMQKSWSPLVATLVIALVWEPWHLPLVFDGVYGEENFALLLGVRLVAILPIAFIMTMLYNISRGSIFLCVLMHACFNTQIKLFIGSELMGLAMILIVIVLLVILKMWRRGSGYTPPDLTKIP